MKKIIALIFLASQAWAAVSFNNASTADRQAGGSYSGSHSVTAGGSNKVAFAAISWNGTTTGAVTAITYGGQTMTSCGTKSTSGTNSGTGMEMFYLVNPPTGSNTLAVTVSNSPTEVYAAMASFNGVDQTTPVRSGSYFNSISSTSAGTTFTHTIQSNANDLTMTAIADDTGISSTNQTQIWSNTTGIQEQYGDRATTGASSVTHTWTFASTGASYVFVGLSVQEVQAGGGASSPVLNFISGRGELSTQNGSGEFRF